MGVYKTNKWQAQQDLKLVGWTIAWTLLTIVPKTYLGISPITLRIPKEGLSSTKSHQRL